MHKLRYPAKFAMLGALFLCVVVYAVLLIREYDLRVEISTRESVGLQYLEPMRTLLQKAQQHRGMASAFLSGNESFRPKLAAKEKELAELFDKLDKLDARMAELLDSGESWRKLKTEWASIDRDYRGMTAAQSAASHTVFIGHLIDFIAHVADSSQLILDAELSSYHLAEGLIIKLPALSEYLGLSRAMGTAALSRGKLSLDDQIRLNSLGGAAASVSHGLDTGLSVALANDAAMNARLRAPLQDLLSQSRAFTDYVEQISKQDARLAVDPAEASQQATAYFNKATEIIDQVFAFADTASSVLSEDLTRRIDRLQTQRTWLISATIAVLTAMCYLLLSFYRVVSESVGGISRFSIGLASGDLTVSFSDRSEDELGVAANAFSRSTENLRRLMREVGESIAQMSVYSQQLVTVSQRTRDDMLRQQGETDQVASAMEQMAATAEHIAISATEAAEATAKADREATDGKAKVEEAMNTVHALAAEVERASNTVRRVVEDSVNITVVLDMITGIAEQTNLLALNAAIEAARAGEQGRGFSVVADEVRKLAVRTQQSTQVIRGHVERLQSGTTGAVSAMDDSRRQTRRCVDQAEQALSSLHAITESMDRITGMTNQIGSATEQQSQVVESINRNVSTVHSIGQETVHGAEAAFATCSRIADLAVRLQEQIRRFKLS